nr:hypothetical protein [Tanacetum cinerariifolium]
MPLSKKKDKMIVVKRKGIKLLSEGKDEYDINNEQDSRSEGSDQDKDSDFESDHEENDEEIGDDEEEEDEFYVRTPSNNFDEETKISDKAEGDEDEEIDYTTSQLYDDVDIRLNKPVEADDETVQKEGTDAELTNIQQGNENPEISRVIEDAHSIPSFTPPPTQSTPTAPPTTKATNPPSTLLDFASVFQFNNKVTTLEKKVAELKKDNPLKTQVAALVDEHLDARLGATIDKFLNFLSSSITARITKQVKNQLPQILPKKLSNFAPPVIQSMITELLNHAILTKESSQPQSSYEIAASLTEFELKRILIDKIDKSGSYLAAPEHRECYKGLIKSYELDKTLFSIYDKVYSLKRSRKDKDKEKTLPLDQTEEELEFEVADSDMPQDQKENPGNDDEEPNGKTLQQGHAQSWLMTLASSVDKPSKTFDELMSTLIDFSAYIMNGLKISNLTQETLLGPAFKLLKGTHSNYPELEYDVEEFMNGNLEMVSVDYFFNNDHKYLQGGILTMTYMNSLTKTNAAHYDLLGIEDMVPNIWNPVKVSYDKYALWGISHWRDQRHSFYGYARGLESTHDVYSTKCILVVTRVEVMRKHGYGYLKVIVVRRADNVLYKFKEGDFSCLRINDIEDMLLLVVLNRLTNLSGDDVSDFAIALRMFTRNIVIQKRVEDLQLGVESYQKKINVTKPKTTRLDIRKKDPYTPYQDPQGFIYVDTLGRNKLMRSDELYKWSTLEKKRANIMIKEINKQLKEGRMMRSLKKFVGGRHYETDLRLLQLAI